MQIFCREFTRQIPYLEKAGAVVSSSSMRNEFGAGNKPAKAKETSRKLKD
jgi:hypothetical protein